MDSAQPAPPIYRGETAARKPAVAFLLTLICPGLGLMYLGRLVAGIAVCLAYVAGASLFLWLWTKFGFFPVLPLAVLLLGGAGVSLLLAIDLARIAGRMGSGYLLKPVNHPFLYGATALCCYFLPLAVLVHFTFTRVWSLVWMDGDGMYPTLADQDLLLVDRTAYQDTEPQAGDLVVARSLDPSSPLQIGRVIGLPGDEVSMEGALPRINGTTLTQRHIAIDPAGLPAEIAALDEVPPPVSSTILVEWIGERAYFIAEQSMGIPMETQATRLGDEEYFLVHDNRSAYADSRDHGPILRSHILGRPLYIAHSVAVDGSWRWNRIARRIQP